MGWACGEGEIFTGIPAGRSSLLLYRPYCNHPVTVPRKATAIFRSSEAMSSSGGRLGTRWGNRCRIRIREMCTRGWCDLEPPKRCKATHNVIRSVCQLLGRQLSSLPSRKINWLPISQAGSRADKKSTHHRMVPRSPMNENWNHGNARFQSQPCGARVPRQKSTIG